MTWEQFGGLVLFLAIAYFFFYKKLYLPAAERRKKAKAIRDGKDPGATKPK